MRILITGAGGFIGFHVCSQLLKTEHKLLGFDNLNNYYSVNLKKDRLKELEKQASPKPSRWNFIKEDLINKDNLESIFRNFSPQVVIHLAAQAGVRYSITNPDSYIKSNLIGFHNILECCKNYNVNNFIYASSSSVYGGNEKTPFLESDNADHPVSLYAATKKSNELLAHSYSHLYGIPSTGLRFFTVYGPWGRPDMAPMIFAKSILKKESIEIFNNGNVARDFTYVDDVVKVILNLINNPAKKDEKYNAKQPKADKSWAPYRIYNIGNNKPIPILDFIEILEENLGMKAIKKFKPMQLGDVKITSANTSSIENLTGIKPTTPLSLGVKEFVRWYKNYYKVN